MTAVPAERAGQPGRHDQARVVAVCQGQRCRALLAGQDPDGMSVLREAVRHSPRGALLSTGCAGPCSHGPVVVLGAGVVDRGTLHSARQAVLGPVGGPQVQALADHLLGEGDRLGPTLAQVRLRVSAA